MLPINIDPNIKYIAVSLFLLGIFLILSGLKIISVEKVSVSSGRRTWVLGLILTIISSFMLLPEFKRDYSKETRFQVSTVTTNQPLLISTLPKSLENEQEQISKDISIIAVEATIDFPKSGMIVKKKTVLKGKFLASEEISAYLVIESKKYGGIYPQGKIQVDSNNKFVIPVIYGSSGAKYKTYIVVTNDKKAMKELEREHYRKYGMSSLPEKSKVVGKPVMYLAKWTN